MCHVQLRADRSRASVEVIVDVRGARACRSDTDISVELPFKSDPDLASQYVNFDKHIRIGLLLEDMDALAANVANAHAQLGPETGCALVTACVDRVAVFDEVEGLLSRDVVMEGVVSWVGRSSIEGM